MSPVRSLWSVTVQEDSYVEMEIGVGRPKVEPLSRIANVDSLCYCMTVKDSTELRIYISSEAGIFIMEYHLSSLLQSS